jgi:hypothetical protein
MRFKATTSKYITADHGTLSCYMWKANEQVADKVWRPLTDAQRTHLEAAHSLSCAVSDYAGMVDLSGFSECRLVLFGDAYTCSVWEVR